MSLLQSILMGIIQGATEFLPVSSSGHLALFKIIFNVNTETGSFFAGSKSELISGASSSAVKFC